jgi:zinc protease
MARLFKLAFIFILLVSTRSTSAADDYAVVVSSTTRQNHDWSAVVEALVQKHAAIVIEYDQTPEEVLPELKKQFPRYTCFVTPHENITSEFIATIHQLTRRLDDDPYTDTFWAVLTGYDAANALAIAEYAQPLEIKKVAAGTEFAIEMVSEGLWYDELTKNKFVQKRFGEPAQQTQGPDDTTQALADVLRDYQPDLFITSGHATEADWQIGFRYANGQFKSRSGQMFGYDSQRRKIEIESNNTKVYLPIGNCLMGNMNGADSMALAWMNDVGVKQMLGYTKPTWYGYMGWGVLDYFVEQPGRFTLTEAFFANNHALVHRLESGNPSRGEFQGLTFDRDVVAFYGDPKWSAKMSAAENWFEQELTIERDSVAGDNYKLSIIPRRGADSFHPVNTNGSQRGGRPFVQYLPQRVSNVELLEGQEFKPVVTDDFILFPNPGECDPDRKYVIRFKAVAIDATR